MNLRHKLKIVKYKSIKEVFKPFLYSINKKGVVFAFIFPIFIISLCSILALLTGLGSLSNYPNKVLLKTLTMIILSIPFSIVTLGEEYG